MSPVKPQKTNKNNKRQTILNENITNKNNNTKAVW
jgi:hypothetical protein